jgi:sugar/nucleoside kinase (ribokinase family)
MTMGVLVVGSVALDSVQTPFGTARDALGGSATFFSVAASFFTDVALVAVVGTDFPKEHLSFLESRGINTEGLTVEEGETFRWAGVYGYDLNDRDTIDTRLNVFEGFRPRVPKSLVDSEFVFLANIDPELQGSVLGQVEAPKLVACDTMNFWIEGKRPELLETMKGIDVMVMNDSECRELAGEPNLIKASRAILGLGPSTAIVKKGEHGALMFTRDAFFSAPAYPCESVFDPTGAGDSFAGGFMGHLARTGDTSEPNIRRAVIYGTVMASFCVEQFSVAGMSGLTNSDIERRFQMLKHVSHFET